VIVRLAVSVPLIILSLLGCVIAYRVGLVGSIVRYAPETELLKFAVKLTPNDPKIYYLLGHAYLHDLDNIDIQESIKALDRAVKLSPNDFMIWLTRAKAFERSGDLVGAEQSVNRAVALAPHYFEPHWQLANLFLRTGKIEQALPEFRRALAANDEQLGYAMELIWQITDGDLSMTESIVPERTNDRIDFIEFLFRKKHFREGTDRWVSLPASVSDAPDWRARQFVEQLFASKEHEMAWEIWSRLPEYSGQKLPKGEIQNGSFEQPMKNYIAGFEWQFDSKEPQARLSIDTASPQSVGRSMRIDYSAEGRLGFDHIRQVVLVEPEKEYRLQYFARSEGLTTGSLPFVEISDAAGRSALRTRSEPMLLGSSDWKQYEIRFKTDSNMHSLMISIRREANCSTDNQGEGPCPIFGRVWFTGFSLEVVKNQ
jgi:hypothetical protein